jgi:uncharacterized protein YndB with AHSA1/START domain
MTISDRIEKQIVLKAPRSRVWRALTDAGEFGAWFGARLAGPFEVGKRVTGKVTTEGYEHLPFDLVVERMDAEHHFAFRWPHVDDLQTGRLLEGMTLVEFRLEDHPEGTQLTLVESGFDSLPADKRHQLFLDNSGGWDFQMANIRAHVAG